MNVPFITVSCLAMMVLGVNLPAFAQKDATDPIAAFYNQSDAAFLKKDTTTLMALFDKAAAANFTSKGADGQIIKRDIAYAFLKQSMNNFETVIERKTDFSNREVKGDRVIVHLKRTEQYRAVDSAGTYGPGGEKHLFKVVITAEHTWVKVKGQLKFEKAETKTRKMNIDGKDR